jgi:hypothetical protein
MNSHTTPVDLFDTLKSSLADFQSHPEDTIVVYFDEGDSTLAYYYRANDDRAPVITGSIRDRESWDDVVAASFGLFGQHVALYQYGRTRRLTSKELMGGFSFRDALLYLHPDTIVI